MNGHLKAQGKTVASATPVVGWALQRASVKASPVNAVPPIVYDALRSSGQSLDAPTRAFLEPRFGYNFSQVRVHTDARAAESARAVNALAYTVGRDVVFGAAQYSPKTMVGTRLLAHELAHVLQQRHTVACVHESPLMLDSSSNQEREAQVASQIVTKAQTVHVSGQADSTLVQRQLVSETVDPLDDPRMHPPGAPKATTCSPPTWCPETFCQPYSSESYARRMRTKMMLGLMAGIAIAVDSRVVPLWREHLLGGSSPKDLSSQFGIDFTNSKTTKKTTAFLVEELKKNLQASPPAFPPGIPRTVVDITSRIPSAIAEIGDPASPNQMNFNIPKEVPGNIAGGIGKDQSTCQAGAKPSPFDDAREAKGIATIAQDVSGGLFVTPLITYTVKDTIDLCPGDCGTSMEQIATVPISQFEATGISGDVPFIVEFPANAPTFAIPAPIPVAPGTPSAPTPKKMKGMTP